MISLVFWAALAFQSPPLGTFDKPKPAPPDKLQSVGVRGAVDAGGYSSSATAKSQSDLFRELAAAQTRVVASLRSCAANRALQSEAAGQIDAAVAQFTALADPKAAVAVGVAHLFAGNLPAASQVFASAQSSLGQGATEFQSGHPDAALQLFLQATKHPLPAGIDPYPFVAVALRTADPKPALSHLGSATSATGHLAYAVALSRSDKAVEAEAQLRKALELDPDLPEAHFQLAALLAAKGDNAAAAQQYETALAQDHSLVEAHYRLSQIYTRLGKVEEARRELAAHARMRDGQRADIAAGRVPVIVPAGPCQ